MTDKNPVECNIDFKQPVKEIKSPMDMGKWLKSEAYRDFMGFIVTVSESVKGTQSTDQCYVSDTLQSMLNMLQTIEDWVDEIPPVEQPMRFGNKAYKIWHQRLVDNSDELITTILNDKWKGSVIELQMYLHDSFGNSFRIDYGTGHEASFILFLVCLYKLRLLNESDNLAIVNKVFKKYLSISRKLQTTYRMEPAGSQGVWGLDDFQFVPYIWGSSQLSDHPSLRPEHIPSEEKAETYNKDYLLFDCLKYIHTVKSGPFAEHSNVLWSISSVPLWAKVNSGLIKMYKAEVVSKFPVIQHFCFGTLLSIKSAT